MTEQVMHAVCRDISLDKRRIRKTNNLLRKKLAIVERGLMNDSLFKKLYKGIFYGGSYYDHLKIRSPDEFDIDFLLEFDERSVPRLEHTNKPGYVSVKFENRDFLSAGEKALLTDGKYISSSKVRSWMQSIVTRCINDYDHKQKTCKYKLRLTDTVKTSGPAITLHVTDDDGFGVDIDLVPCFQFTTWPVGGFRKNPTNIDPFFIVPKSVDKTFPHSDRYWRLSFQKQERHLIHDRQLLKPTCRLIKALRDSFDQKEISSYFIKTIFLFVDDQNKSNFWCKSQKEMFLIMLDYYIHFIQQGHIFNFWNQKHDLLANVSKETLHQYANQLKHFKNIFFNEPEQVRKQFKLKQG